MQTTYTIQQVKANHEKAGGYFFSRDTMRCFGDTLESLQCINTDHGPIIYRSQGDSKAWRFDTTTWRCHILLPDAHFRNHQADREILRDAGLAHLIPTNTATTNQEGK